jgi:hypothetical protein
VSRNAIIGAILWVALAGGSVLNFSSLAPIELLFLLAPLVIVPLGLELSMRLGHSVKDHPPPSYARWIQLPAALGVVASFWLPQGAGAVILALPWFSFGCFLGFWGLMRLVRGGFRNMKLACAIVSFAYLPIGCAWLVASRYGLNPMGFQEPIVLLTAVHFHFAGFAAPLLTAATAETVERATAPIQKIFRIVATGVLAGPGLLAAGFVIGPRLKLACALLVVLSDIGLAFFFLFAVRELRPRLAQALVTLSSASVLFSMVLAGIWAVGEFPFQPFVHLAEMARFHGTANALGFTLCGLLGWTISVRGAMRETGSAS